MIGFELGGFETILHSYIHLSHEFEYTPVVSSLRAVATLFMPLSEMVSRIVLSLRRPEFHPLSQLVASGYPARAHGLLPVAS